MSYTLKHQIYEALELNDRQKEVADLIDWQNLRGGRLGELAACYHQHLGITQIDDEFIDSAPADAVLATLLHEKAHEFVGRVLGEWEAHNKLFAGICWGLQSRAGVQSGDPNYDIQDGSDEAHHARAIATRIARADTLDDALELIRRQVENRRSNNKREALYAIPKMFAMCIGIPVLLLILSGNGRVLAHLF